MVIDTRNNIMMEADSIQQQKSKSKVTSRLCFIQLAVIWSAGILAAHIVAILTGKEDLLKQVLNAYIDACPNSWQFRIKCVVPQY